jgi:hypothetical protein
MLRLSSHEGAAAVGQARAGAESRRAPAPSSSRVCRSTPSGGRASRGTPAPPADSACAQKAAASGSSARGPDRRAAARGARSLFIGLATPRSLRVDCEYRAEASAPSPLRHLVVSAPAAPFNPRPQLPTARLAVHQMTDMHRELPEGGSRQGGRMR